MSVGAARLDLVGRRRLTLAGRAAALALVAAGGIALRVWLDRSALGIPNADEATVGLMALHALHGHLTTFIWGQAYGGSQEALLTAPLVALLGASWLALRLVPAALAAVAAVLVWRVGLRTIDRRAAAVAAALLWLWPPFLLNHLGHGYGFYATGLVDCALLLLLALRLVERPTRARAAVLGLVAGLAFWQTSQIVPILVPVALWVARRRPAALRHLWLAVAAFALGALPWLAFNLRHGFASLHLQDTGSSYAHRLRQLFSPLLAELLGLRTPWSAKLLLPHLLTLALYALLLVAFLGGAYRARRRATSLLYAVAALFPFVYALSPLTYVDSEPRYLLVASPVLVLLVAQPAAGYRRGAALLAVAAAVSVVTLQRMDAWASVRHDGPAAPPRAFGPLIATLERLRINRVYADYWVAYRLDFETRERIVAANNRFRTARTRNGRVIPAPDPWRYPPYARAVAAAPRAGFVFLRPNIGLARIVPDLARAGYRRYAVGDFIVYAPPASLR